MKIIFYPILVAFVLVSNGCSVFQVDSRTETTKYYPPKTSVSEVAYLESLDKPYEVIGTVIVTTERRQALENVIPKMLYEASVMGGDAITDIQTDATGAWKKIKPQALLGNAYIRSNYSAKVVVFNKD